MSDIVEFTETPKADEMYMIAGWRQWADAGSISSGLPQYLIQEMGAKRIGTMKSDGFYLFQIPGTHDLVRPVVQFDEGYPKSLEVRRNKFCYTENNGRGLVIFLGDEPHMDIERYTDAMLDAAEKLGVKRIITFGGVYGELPYDKERMVSMIYSQPKLQTELEALSVNFSDYHGGASIGSYICRRAADRNMEAVGFFAFVPTYDFSNIAQIGNAIRIENDFMAWRSVMRRVNYMLKTEIDLRDLDEKSQRLLDTVEAKLDEIDGLAPELGVRNYMARLADDFEEQIFDPLADVWTDEISRLFDDDKEE